MSKQIIKKGSASFAAILISRIFGLLRDVLMARFIGGGAMMSAWVLAFRVANTFRGFFGEGAASQALMPLLSHLIEKDGQESARKSFATITATLGIFLAVISILVGVICILIRPYFPTLRVHTALTLLPILMPFTIFVCLTGIFTSILNLFGRFFLPALSSAIMNIAIISALILFGGLEPGNLLFHISWAVLISGVIQLVLMLLLLKKCNMLPTPLIPGWKNSPAIKEFIALAIPGFIGAAAFQINSLVDSFIAIYLSNYAAPALYYSERLIYLPVGIFAVSFGNACLATMSKNAATDKGRKIASTLEYGLKQIIFITVPITIFLLLFRTPIISMVFGGNKFGDVALRETAYALLFYSFGIPAFSALKIIVSAFYSRKDMKTPVRVTFFCVFLNLALNLCLMIPLQQGGIALATVISSFANCIILLFILRKTLDQKINISGIILTVVKIIVFSIVAASLALLLDNYLLITQILKGLAWKTNISLIFSGVFFIIIYFLINMFTGSSEQKEWVSVYLGGIKKRLLGR